MQVQACQLPFLANRNAELADSLLFWQVNCIKIEVRVALLSGPTLYSLYCALTCTAMHAPHCDLDHARAQYYRNACKLKDTDPSLQSSCKTIVMADRGCIVVSIAESQVFLINLSIAFSAHPSNVELLRILFTVLEYNIRVQPLWTYSAMLEHSVKLLIQVSDDRKNIGKTRHFQDKKNYPTRG